MYVIVVIIILRFISRHTCMKVSDFKVCMLLFFAMVHNICRFVSGFAEAPSSIYRLGFSGPNGIVSATGGSSRSAAAAIAMAEGPCDTL